MGTTGSSAQPSHSSSALSHLRSSYKKKKKDEHNDGGYVRRAHHAGSWYESSPKELDALLTKFLADAAASSSSSPKKEEEEEKTLINGTVENGNGEKTSGGDSNNGTPRAIISPHAGYSYSGPTAAYAYMALVEALSATDGDSDNIDGSDDESETEEKRERKICKINTIVVLHPSHHVRLDNCAVSGASVIETPLLNLPVDQTLRSQLLSTNKFSTMTQSTDEHEHSGEMQYPYIAKAVLDSSLSETPPNVLPIMVGGIHTSREEFYGTLLAPVLARKDVFTIVSTDFCHWGRRFGYVPTSSPCETEQEEQKMNIHEYIQWLDTLGMNHIESQKPGAFADYLRMYSNTICGRHPIGVWLNAIVAATAEKEGEEMDVSFVRYAQSGQVVSMRESSVSYASAVARTRKKQN